MGMLILFSTLYLHLQYKFGISTLTTKDQTQVGEVGTEDQNVNSIQVFCFDILEARLWNAMCIRFQLNKLLD